MGIENAGRLPAAAAFHNMAVYYAPRPAIVAEDRPASQVLAIEEQVEAITSTGSESAFACAADSGLGPSGSIMPSFVWIRKAPPAQSPIVRTRASPTAIAGQNQR